MEPTEQQKPRRLYSRRYITFVGVVMLILVLLSFTGPKQPAQAPVKSPALTVSIAPTKAVSISYKGQEGKDALTLLKAQTTVEQDKTGLVTVINGQKADASTHTYWAFYVNGKLASVGPADYKTKDTDTIEWKVEKY